MSAASQVESRQGKADFIRTMAALLTMVELRFEFGARGLGRELVLQYAHDGLQCGMRAF